MFLHFIYILPEQEEKVKKKENRERDRKENIMERLKQSLSWSA